MGRLPHDRLRLGRISYLNVLPIYYPLEAGIVAHPFELVSGPPAYLNRLMAEGELDLSVVSSIEYARHAEQYYVLPDLSISCNGAVKSVLLLSRKPVEQLGEKTVLVSTQSHTSVALLKILFSIHLGMNVDFEPGSCAEALGAGRLPDAFLAIGDEALQLRRHKDYPFCMDLGDAWHRWTGLPFVFALWIIQKKAVERWNGTLATALETLSSAKTWGRTNLDAVCRQAAERGILNCAELNDYYEALGYNLFEEEKKGLELFFKYLLEIGEVCEVPRLDIYSPLACVA